MQIMAALKLAQSLMAEHGLRGSGGWGFEFDTARRRFGACHYVGRKITLSRTLVSLNDEKQVRQTILHEIAHALAGAGAGHGPTWRAIAIKIGDYGERCYDDSVATLAKRFLGTCPTCKRQVTRDVRLGKLACGKCCAKDGKHWVAEHVFTWVRNPGAGKPAMLAATTDRGAAARKAWATRRAQAAGGI
jgi:predicted SprT family Zn-dependent metalloprotease